jgi:hypothetical protein
MRHLSLDELRSYRDAANRRELPLATVENLLQVLQESRETWDWNPGPARSCAKALRSARTALRTGNTRIPAEARKRVAAKRAAKRAQKWEETLAVWPEAAEMARR